MTTTGAYARLRTRHHAGLDGKVGRVNKRILGGAVALVLVLGLAACGSSGSDAASSDSGAAKTTAASGGDSGGGGGSSSCDGYTNGKDGVIRTFCDGTATVKITTDGKTHEIKGGTCEMSQGYFSVNIGVVVDQTHTGSKPDYFGGLFPEKAGDFSGDKVTATFTVDGKGVPLRDVTGTHDAKSVTFTGTPYGIDGGPVTGTVTC